MASHTSDPPKPDWLRVRYHGASSVAVVRGILRNEGLKTVCDSSQCPNLGECWAGGHATILILGETCTRHCRFCAVPHGRPQASVDDTEPERVARAVKELGLNHVVLTSVTRDDLKDGGASAFAGTVRAIRTASPQTRVELLIPDLGGSWEALETVVDSGPEVIGHNIEVVRSLQESIRDRRADYGRSLALLRQVKRRNARMVTKSSIMLGLGEERAEVIECMSDLRDAEVDLLTLGQYLRPRHGELPVKRYVTPEEFADLRSAAEALGFSHVESGPFVRSSYRAEAAFNSIVRG